MWILSHARNTVELLSLGRTGEAASLREAAPRVSQPIRQVAARVESTATRGAGPEGSNGRRSFVVASASNKPEAQANVDYDMN